MKNPGTEAFDRFQKRAAIPIILIVPAIVIWRNGVPWIFLPFAILVCALYLLVVMGGARVIRNFRLKTLGRNKHQ